MTPLPVFPLGGVLLPTMPISLRVFEPRYRTMLRDIFDSGERRFGIVLIERGHEVGGGDARFPLGTVAQVGDLRTSSAGIHLQARGTERFEVKRWLPEDPYPNAEIRPVPDLVWSNADRPLLERAEKVVRRGLARASEFGDIAWRHNVTLPGEGAARAWQLAGIAPLSPLDSYDLLGSATASELLQRLIAHVDALEETWLAAMRDDDVEG